MERQQRLLVVDDEPSVLQLFRSAFEKHGIEVLTADTARAGLKVASEQKPDVGIFDLMLPDWSGLDLLEGSPEAGRAAAGHLHHRRWHECNRD